MEVFDGAELTARLARSGEAWTEFLRVPALSAGLYRLPAGAEDRQTPHHEDEVYVIIAGRASLRVEGEDRPVGPGSIAFVAAESEHRFHSIDEDLAAVVVFAPAESLDEG